MVDSRPSVATPSGQQSLFSVLGGAVTRAALQQMQRDVDVLCEVSASAHASLSPGPRPEPVAAPSLQPGASGGHPLQRVLDALRSAEVGALPEGGNDERRAQPSSTSISVRDALIDALGLFAGSSLYREWVQAPRRRIRRVVRQLAITVRERYLSLLAERHSLAREEPLDVHVQLYPSHTVQRTAVPAALKETQGFCAAVTVRRLSALEEKVTAARRLRQRYMQAAAPGQTLSSVLSFWADVSYGDAPPAALIDYPPLGFEEDSSRLTVEALQASRDAAAAEGRRQLGRKTQRASEDADGPAHPALLLGVEEESSTVTVTREGLEGEEGPAWLQPPLLLQMDDGLKDRQFAAATTAGRMAPVPHLRYEGAGLLAVMYVHSSGIAYVGYPHASDTASSAEPTDGLVRRPDDEPPVDPLAVAPPTPPSWQQLPPAPICSLPMSSSTGFVRGLLGLS
ncbi:hypothetical protein CGC21_27810 [Leishmania donovani]|uniref:Uncharacterized protein n=2 Tax=Leishmania donovani TaxID=5661 RepID=A0A504Y5H0_LEIDO|nr:hypothetical protein CGC21_27810 [Leishmania donovani]